MNDLNARLIAAHEAGNKAGLVALYTEAADQTDHHDTACFFLTQAYIFALDAGDPAAAALHHRLAQAGRV